MSFKTMLTGLAAVAVLAACQKTPEYYMTLSDKQLSTEAEGGKVTFSLSTNTYVRVNNDIEWAAISIASEEGDVTTYALDVQPNTATQPRTGTVRFIGDGVTPLKFTLNQAGIVPVGVSVSEISALRTDTSAEFTVLGNKPWTAVCDNPAFKLSLASGTGETPITVTFPVNETDSPAVAVITVTISGTAYKVTITQAGYPKKEYVDLSAASTSNCYIVDKVGYYKFKATVRGNGTVPESCNGSISADIATKGVKLLWSSFNTATAPEGADAIITGLELKDGYVCFNTASLETIVSANAVIGAFDDAACTGNIIWSWHIWICEGAPTASEVGGAQWMDRNLGATCANVKGDARSCGLFYQWGRKDPLRSASTFDEGEFIATFPAFTDAQVQIMNTDGNGTIEATIANPMTFVVTTKTYKDWVYAADHKDRWSDAKKTMFDPCPVGYRVPTSAQIGDYGLAGGIPSGSQKGDEYKAAYKAGEFVFETSAWSLPLAGILSYDDGTKITDYAKVCRLVSSTYHASTAMTAMYLNCNASACNFANAATAAHASSVRCVKE